MKRRFHYSGLLCWAALTLIFPRSTAAITLLESDSIKFAKALGTAMADTVDHVMPSVVVIETQAAQRFFDLENWQARTMQRPIGQGSGVIFSHDGYVLTNNHVLQGAQSATVVLFDGREYEASYIGHYPEADIAVLKINVPEEDAPLIPIEQGNSDEIRVGEWVLAIGSPFSLQSTVTQGIISQKGRQNDSLPVIDFLQTSAPINPGNSGGPLVDLDGRLIGINTYIQTAGPYSGGNIGIGFAIPSNQALGIARLLIQGKKPRSTWIGITTVETRYGIFVTSVEPNAPADRAGILPRDLIISLDNERVTSFSSLRNKILRKRPGQTITAQIVRDGSEEKEVEMKIEFMPDRTPEFR